MAAKILHNAREGEWGKWWESDGRTWKQSKTKQKLESAKLDQFTLETIGM